MACFPSAEPELPMHWGPRHHRGSQGKLSPSRCRGTPRRRFTVSSKMNFLDTGHIFQSIIHGSREPAIISENGCSRNISGCEFMANAPPNKSKFLWCTRKGVIHISEEEHKHSLGIMRTAEELNEMLISFTHSLNRSGNYNLPNTSLRSGEKKTHPSPLKSSIQWERQTKTDDYTHIMSWAIPSTSIQLEWLRRDLTETDHQLTPYTHSSLHLSGRILPLQLDTWPTSYSSTAQYGSH